MSKPPLQLVFIVVICRATLPSCRSFQEKKIQLFPAIYSSKLINAWQEPCIVLCSHWSLRLGPVISLLQRWCEDSRFLLIFEEGIDAKLAHLPFVQAANN